MARPPFLQGLICCRWDAFVAVAASFAYQQSKLAHDDVVAAEPVRTSGRTTDRDDGHGLAMFLCFSLALDRSPHAPLQLPSQDLQSSSCMSSHSG